MCTSSDIAIYSVYKYYWYALNRVKARMRIKPAKMRNLASPILGLFLLSYVIVCGTQGQGILIMSYLEL